MLALAQMALSFSSFFCKPDRPAFDSASWPNVLLFGPSRCSAQFQLAHGRWAMVR